MGKVEQVKALETGNGIQRLMNTAYEILNNPIYMIDINYNLISYTDVPVDDPNWNEIMADGTFSLKTLEIFADKGLLETITNSDKSVVLRNDTLKYAKIAGHIFNRNNIDVGLLMMTEYNVAFDEESIEAFEHLADKITSEISAYDYFTTLAMTFHEDKINLLLDGTVKNPLLYNPQAQVLYNDFEDYLYVAVVYLEQNYVLEDVHRNKMEYFESLLKTKYPLFKYSVYSDYIVMIMSSKSRYSYGAPFFITQAELFEQNGLFIGVSNSFENMYELRAYFDQAVAALTDGLKNKKDQRVFIYNGSL